MTSSFGAASTADDVLNGVDLRDKRILVTGTSAGLGIETARALVAHGASVVGAARDLAKAEVATQAVRSAAQASEGAFELIELDLAAFDSIRSAADRLLSDGRAFDAVICNAGVMAAPFGHTREGFETQFGTNHLGHFVLANRIAPLLRKGGRLVVLSSAGHRFADVDLDDPNFDQTPYDPWVAYGRSKTANVLFAVEFDRRYRDSGIRATAVHPGGIRTELGRHLSAEAEAALISQINAGQQAAGLPPFSYKSIPQGAATSLWAAVVADAAEIGGRYCEDCHVAAIQDGEGIRGGVRPYALDGERAKALWARSEEWVRQAA